MSTRQQDVANLIWSVADLLRGDYKLSEYGNVILPFTVLRRFDCVLADTKSEVLAKNKALAGQIANVGPILKRVGGHNFYNTSEHNFVQLLDDPDSIGKNLRAYVAAFSPNVIDVLEQFRFIEQVTRLEKAGLLYVVTSRFASIDLHPRTLDNDQISRVFEDLIRKFSELSDQTAGEHFTPRDVIRLMVSLLLAPDEADLTVPGAARTIYDPACGTGGLLAETDQQIRHNGKHAFTRMYGQELNSETHAICCSDILIKGGDPEYVKLGNSFTDDQYPQNRGENGFDYMLSNPPFGVEWKRVQRFVENERDVQGWAGRFGAGTPRINDGSLLFLQHMLSKMRPANAGGSRVAIVFNGSPLFSGTAGSGESEIRRWILENDWLEVIVALPDQLFYNTGISTYFWILSNRKVPMLRDKVVVLDGRDYWSKMRRSLGYKRKLIDDDQVTELTEIYRDAIAIAADPGRAHHAKVKILSRHAFGYQRIVIERPLRLRFEITQETLTALRDSKPLAGNRIGNNLARALKPLLGSVWRTKREAFDEMRHTVISGGFQWPSAPSALRAIRSAVGVTDPEGERQIINGQPEPDPDLRDNENVPLTAMESSPGQLRAEIEQYVQREILRNTPDAWVDYTKVKIGFEISRLLFITTKWAEPFEPLKKFARQVATRPVTSAAELQLPVLRMSELQRVNFATELTEVPVHGERLTRCSEGDVVGSGRNWRLLPSGFGVALTPLTVLHPIGHTGRALSEWLNSTKINDYDPGLRVSGSALVPASVITDPELDQLLEDLNDGRHKLRQTTSRILPNIFDDSASNIDDIRRTSRSAASEARMLGELVLPLEDLVWRAEWSYPYHAAALARQYRFASTLQARKEAILKLGEGIARTLGVLSLAVLIRRQGSFSNELRGQFLRGATFGTWLTLIRQLLANGSVPELPELGRAMDPASTYQALQKLLAFRNDSGHAHGIRSHYELKEEIERIEPVLLSILGTVSWLSGLSWNLLEECQFLGNGYLLRGWRLRGSHPDWEPFSRPSVDPIIPNRVYSESSSSGASIDLWPVARCEVCTKCHARELFLLDKINGDTLLLRSLKDHSIDYIME